MVETGIFPENLEIPEHWQVEEVDRSLPVLQIDLGERYLGLEKAYPNTPPSQAFETKEYFFDIGGFPSRSRNYFVFSKTNEVALIRKRGGIQCEYGFTKSQGEPYSISVEFYGIEDVLTPLLNPKHNLGDLVHFTDAKSSSVRMRAAWVKDAPKPPQLEFSNDKDQFMKKEWNCHKILDAKGFRVLDQEEPNKLVFTDKTGRIEYIVVWNTVVEDRDGKEIPFFVVDQSHFDSDNNEMRKILRTPISIDLEKVKSALLPKPPYLKERKVGKDRLVVPWTNIDQLVGATISYPSTKTIK